MNISYNWLKRYIDTDLPAEKVAEILTDIGLEVEGFEKIETVKAASPSIPSTSRLSRCTALHLLLTSSLHRRASPTLHRR